MDKRDVTGKGPRVFGRAGQSADRASKTRWVQTYRKQPWVPLAGAGALGVAIVASAASALGGPVLVAAGVTAAILLAVHLILRRPGVLATCAVIAAFIYLASSAGIVYGLVEHRVNLGDGKVILTLTALLIGLLAHRTSRGRPWVTTLLALLAVTFVGPAVLVVAPRLGFYAAYACASVVLALRAGGWLWLVDRVLHLKGTAQSSAADRAARKGKVDSWRKGAAGERRTADLLSHLSEAFTVMHDLALPGTEANADHLVLGPTGLFYVDTKAYSGVVRENDRKGLTVAGRPLAPALSAVLFERQRIADELGVDADQVAAVVVIHDAVLPAPRFVTDLFSDEGRRVGRVTVCSPDTLLAEIETGVASLEGRKVKALVARARLRLVPAATFGVRPKPKGPVQRTPRAAGAVRLDNDGHAVLPDLENNGPAEPLFRSTTVDTVFSVGQQVSIVTDQGVFTGYRIVEADVQVGDDGAATVQLCPEDEWHRAQRQGRRPDGLWYPAASISGE